MDTGVFGRAACRQPRKVARPWAAVALALALAYGGGLWLHLLHEGSGAAEHNAPAGVIHWLRDSTLALPAVLLAVWLALFVARRVLEWSDEASSGLLAGAVPAYLVAVFASVLMAAAGPIHAALFAAHHSGHELPLIVHMAQDGLLALTANLVIAGVVCLLFGGRLWTRSRATRAIRIVRLHPTMAVRRTVILPFLALSLAVPSAAIVPPSSLAPGVGVASAASLPPQAVESSAPSAQQPVCERNISADVVALDQVIYYNRLGARNPEGMIYALKRDVVDKPASTGLQPGKVQLREDKRPRPLTLRMNVGDCLQVTFTNLLAPTPLSDQPATRNVGLHVMGMQLVNSILDDGSNVGQNPTSLTAPGETKIYTFYGEREGTYLVYSPVDNVSSEGIGTHAFGLFGALNVEPRGSLWFRSQLTRDEMNQAVTGHTPDGHPIIDYDALYTNGLNSGTGVPILKILDANNRIVHSDLTAIIAGPKANGYQFLAGTYPANPSYPNRNQPFREFTIVFHDEIKALQAFGIFDTTEYQDTLHGVRDGFAINYGSAGAGAEIVANRLGVGPMASCVECKYEEFFLTSWAVGDPATVVDVPANISLQTGQKATKALYPEDPSNVYHSYLNDHVKFRNLHVGKEHHIFHLHSHQWLNTPDDDNSSYLDSQAIGPGAGFTYEIAYNGSGNRNKTPGDSIFHCHFYPHFAQGMWALWRVHDTFEAGTALDDQLRPLSGSRALPDAEITKGTPIPALVPMPSLPMAPMPGSKVSIEDGQVKVAPLVGGGTLGNPGYPFFIAGQAGHRPPTPPLDIDWDGGLPRHIITGGHAEEVHTTYSFTKELTLATAKFVDENGTPEERAAMDFHAKLRHDAYKPDGTFAAASFETNGRPPVAGAPYADPCRNDDGTKLALGTYTADSPRIWKAADIQFDMKINKVGWHVPQARILTLWSDVQATLNGTRAPEPFVMRGNSGDCIKYFHTNLVPSVYQQDAFQVATPTDVIGQHIHLVKFDVTSADGSGNGFNYEDGTMSPDEVRERIRAIRAGNGCGGNEITGGDPRDVTDSNTCPLAKPHPYFGAGPNSKYYGARTTIQRWWADPVVNNRGEDRTLGSVYTHDHYGPSTHQQVGLYATLIIEPKDSKWRNPETGAYFGVNQHLDGGPTSWRADIITADPKDSHREFYLEFQDFQLAYEAGRGIDVQGRPIPDPMGAINPPGMTEISADGVVGDVHVVPAPPPTPGEGLPKLMAKPGTLGQANTCPNGKVFAKSDPAAPEQGCPEAISAADVGTFSVNYRNEPIPLRVRDPRTDLQAASDQGDLSLAFSSRIARADASLNVQPTFYPPLTKDIDAKDPFTPLMRAYDKDRVRIRIQVGATEEGHTTSIHGVKWLQEYASKNSGYRNSQMLGISEQFILDMPVGSASVNQAGTSADHLYMTSASVDGIWNGNWGILRSYKKLQDRSDNLLLPLPNNPIGRDGLAIKNRAQFNGPCPLNAPVRTFKVTAVTAKDALPGGTLVYNSRTASPLHDPTAILYVRSEDLDANGVLKSGVPVEPLILRASAGDCIKVQLQNRLPGVLDDLAGYNLMPPIIAGYNAGPAKPDGSNFNANDVKPSSRVGLHPQLVAFDVTRGDGATVGRNPDQTLPAGVYTATQQYLWYAGDVSLGTDGNLVATPMELGAINLMSPDRIKHSSKGAIGALIIEPKGATWVEDTGSRASATVTYKTAAGTTATFRDFVLLFQDDLNLRWGRGTDGNGDPLPFVGGEEDAEDSGAKGLNYRAEPLWFRMGKSPYADEGEQLGWDFSNVLSNSLVGGDPQTPVFSAAVGTPVRFRVLQPGGHARNHVFVLHGHVWQREPYVSDSRQIGTNPFSEWKGSQEGHGPTNHFDVVPEHGAGGKFGVTGDYLFRDFAPGNFYNGVWGIFRVTPAATALSASAQVMSPGGRKQ